MHRLLYLFVIIILSCIGLTSVQAQDSSSEQSAESVFAKASNSQIEEAQRYYRACIGNETLSARKNCKCATIEYLNARMRLGNAAAINTILDEISQSCMLDGNSPPPRSTKTSAVTDKQKAEAIDVYHQCKSSPEYSQHFKCDCLASRFLDKRIEHGPFISRRHIIAELGSECKNVVQKTGLAFTRCMEKPIFFDLKTVFKRDYCECKAREFSKLYENYERHINSTSQSVMEEQAAGICRKKLIP